MVNMLVSFQCLKHEGLLKGHSKSTVEPTYCNGWITRKNNKFLLPENWISISFEKFGQYNCTVEVLKGECELCKGGVL